MIIKDSHTAPKLKKAERLSNYIIGLFPALPSKKSCKNALKKGDIVVDGFVANSSTLISGGETISHIFNENISDKNLLEMSLDVIFEDEHIALINKPAGIVVSGNKHKTLENALPFNIKKSNESDSLQWPQPVHRLDYPTTGILLIAKTASSVMALNKAFENKEVIKEYLAVCAGEINDTGVIDSKINGKVSKTEYRVLEKTNSDRYKQLNLLLVKPFSGRRHQIRIHLSELGFPIMGDHVYGDEMVAQFGKGLYLHAYSLQFQHPVTDENVRFSSEIPEKFRKLFSVDLKDIKPSRT